MNARPRPRALGTALVIAAIALAGCGTAAGPAGVSGATTAPGAAIVPGTAGAPGTGTAAAAAVPGSAPAAGIGAPVAARPFAAAGRVEIRLRGLAARRLMATTADVDRIKVTLSGGPLAAPIVQEVTAAALATGKGTVAFEEVPHGTVDVTIEVRDAAGEKIGEKSASATVMRGETAVVAVALQLTATHVASENGNLALDLEVQDGEVIVNPIASPSPRPSTPVLSPAPSPTPTPTPGGVAIDGALERTWFADGTIEVEGDVKNGGAVATPVTVKVTWRRKGLFGWKTVETRTLELGSVSVGERRGFSATSTKKVATIFSEGTAEAEVVSP